MGFRIEDPWAVTPAPLGSGIAGMTVGADGMMTGGTDGILSGGGFGDFGGGGFDWMGTAAKVAGGMMGKSNQSSSSAYQNSDVTVDHSGWNVNFGAGTIDSNRTQTPTGSMLQLGVMALGALVAWKVLRHG